MKRIFLITIMVIASTQAFASKPCEELKSEITKNIDAKGVKSYSLEVVASADVGNQKVVGSCDGGTKKITYSKK